MGKFGLKFGQKRFATREANQLGHHDRSSPNTTLNRSGINSSTQPVPFFNGTTTLNNSAIGPWVQVEEKENVDYFEPTSSKSRWIPKWLTRGQRKEPFTQLVSDVPGFELANLDNELDISIPGHVDAAALDLEDLNVDSSVSVNVTTASAIRNGNCTVRHTIVKLHVITGNHSSQKKCLLIRQDQASHRTDISTGAIVFDYNLVTL